MPHPRERPAPPTPPPPKPGAARRQPSRSLGTASPAPARVAASAAAAAIGRAQAFAHRQNAGTRTQTDARAHTQPNAGTRTDPAPHGSHHVPFTALTSLPTAPFKALLTSLPTVPSRPHGAAEGSVRRRPARGWVRVTRARRGGAGRTGALGEDLCAEDLAALREVLAQGLRRRRAAVKGEELVRRGDREAVNRANAPPQLAGACERACGLFRALDGSALPMMPRLGARISDIGATSHWLVQARLHKNKNKRPQTTTILTTTLRCLDGDRRLGGPREVANKHPEPGALAAVGAVLQPAAAHRVEAAAAAACSNVAISVASNREAGLHEAARRAHGGSTALLVAALLLLDVPAAAHLRRRQMV